MRMNRGIYHRNGSNSIAHTMLSLLWEIRRRSGGRIINEGVTLFTGCNLRVSYRDIGRCTLKENRWGEIQAYLSGDDDGDDTTVLVFESGSRYSSAKHQLCVRLQFAGYNSCAWEQALHTLPIRYMASMNVAVTCTATRFVIKQWTTNLTTHIRPIGKRAPRYIVVQPVP